MTGTEDAMELLRKCSLNILIQQNGWDQETLDLIYRLGQNIVKNLETKNGLKRCSYGLTNENSHVTSCVLDGPAIWMLRRMCKKW